MVQFAFRDLLFNIENNIKWECDSSEFIQCIYVNAGTHLNLSCKPDDLCQKSQFLNII
jgi:hypothetical protein